MYSTFDIQHRQILQTNLNDLLKQANEKVPSFQLLAQGLFQRSLSKPPAVVDNRCFHF